MPQFSFLCAMMAVLVTGEKGVTVLVTIIFVITWYSWLRRGGEGGKDF
jgi:hypothetical protein